MIWFWLIIIVSIISVILYSLKLKYVEKVNLKRKEGICYNKKDNNTYEISSKSIVNKKDINCPNCGANIEIKLVGECEYCHANIIISDRI